MNVAVLGERNVERFGEYTSLVFEGTESTNLEGLARSARLASALAEIGIAPGDRVGVMLPNLPEVGWCYGAILRCGGVAVPMIFLLAVPEIRHILVDSEAKLIFTSPEFWPNVRLALEDLPSPPIVVVTGQAPDEPGVVTFDALLGGVNDPLAIVGRAPEDLAVISYTSGTTGRPKGVMLTHANMLFNAENTAAWATVEDGETSIACLPLAHLFGLGASITGQLRKVRGILLRWFTAEGFFEAVQTHRANSSALVPAMVQFMLAHPGFDEVDWSSFSRVVVAAAPVPVEMAEEFEKRTGSRVLEGYGLTETSPTVSLMRREDARRPGSCGHPVSGIEVEIHDDNDVALPPREQGEVVVRGPNVMKGYYNLPEETAAAMRNGWFHTGDIGYLDEDGFLSITDRKKDMIIRGGFNIYPRDVEEVLYGHPSVQECAVVGVPHATLGEEVTAFVVLRPGKSASEDELLAHCCEQVAKYKAPKSISFLDALPKNPVGKILKRDLRERAKEGLGS